MGPRTHAAWLGYLGVRRRTRLRRRYARPRSALRAHQRIRQGHVPQAGRDGGDLDSACTRRAQALRARCRALYPADVLGRGGRVGRPRAARPESTRWCLTLFVAPMPKPAGNRITLSPLSPPDARMRAGRGQGRLPLSEQCAGADRSARARLRQLPDVRHAGQCRRDGHRQYFHGERRRRVHAGGERHLSRRHHAGSRHQAVARGRRAGGRNDVALFRFSVGRRDFFLGQLLQSVAGHAHRRADFAAGSGLSQSPRALLGIRARRGRLQR